ncbi:MAG: hypothetical protein A2X36_14770 [Elusimicrobia bacterium GWA2_69_24]|nr:MAG: hypothetical protein A2X36_14770 [Elusimicrobia bacterium GWA2_69_24]HBL16842.1 hypothetical protein [Elusimicrobiota bacterium]
MPALYTLLAMVFLPALLCGQEYPWTPPQTSADPCKVPEKCEAPLVGEARDYGAEAAAAAEASPRSTPALQGCTDSQKKNILRALNGDGKKKFNGAKARVLTAKKVLDATSLTPELQRANQGSKAIFGAGLEITGVTITETLGSMNKALGSPALRCAKPADDEYKYCEARPAFIVIGQTVVWLCPDFFKSSDESRARTLVHESSHLSGVGESQGESYCMIFSCSESCSDSGFLAADNWASFVNCAAGEASDEADVITAD